MSPRPTYETREDRELEEKIIALLGDHNKLPMKYEVDYALLNEFGRITAWVEVKKRNNPSHQYKDYMISLKKWVAGKSLSRTTGAPFFLLVQFTDKTMMCNTTWAKPQFGFKGRTDRNDPQDEEPVVYIPMRNFVAITKNGGETSAVHRQTA